MTAFLGRERFVPSPRSPGRTAIQWGYDNTAAPAEEVAMPYATGSGVRIHYHVEGNGAPLLLHTGFMSSIADWYSAGYVDALKAEHLLVLLDPRGQGDSDKPHKTALYIPAHRVADVLAVLDA